MNWWKKALAGLVLDFWLHPFVVWPAAFALLFWKPGLVLITLLPTLFLLVAIVYGHAFNKGFMPDWAWFMSTPDATKGSPYYQDEPKVLSYYKFGWLIGDYLWLSYRNSWYGLSFAWGVWPKSDWVWKGDGDPYTADTNPETKAFVYGHLKIEATQNGERVAWSRRGAIKTGQFMHKYWFGWKVSEYVQKNGERKPPAMLARQIEVFRKAP